MKNSFKNKIKPIINNKRWFFCLLFLFFAKINIAVAANFEFDITNPPNDLIGLIMWLFTLAVIIGAFILAFILIKAGIIYLTSIGNPNRMKNALADLKYSFLGIGLLLGSVLILITLNPELLRPRPRLVTAPIYLPPPPPPPPLEPKPLRVYLAAVHKTNIGDAAGYGPEQKKMFKTGVGQPFSLVMKFYGEPMSCRSLGVTHRHPLDIRFEIDPRNKMPDKFFEVWRASSVPREIGLLERAWDLGKRAWGWIRGVVLRQADEQKIEQQKIEQQKTYHWWGWRLERNTFIDRYPKDDFNGWSMHFKGWTNILFHQDHLKPNTKGIEKIMAAGNYNEMPLYQLFGPDHSGCIKKWTGDCIVGDTMRFNCDRWKGLTNNFTNQEALIRLEQTYGRLPYCYIFEEQFINKSRIFYYVVHHDVFFFPDFPKRQKVWHFPLEGAAGQNLIFDYPGVYTFRMECVGINGEVVPAETSVAVFPLPEITITTPTFTAYQNEKITVHVQVTDAEKCELIEPIAYRNDWGRPWDGKTFYPFPPYCRYRKDENLTNYIFVSKYVAFINVGHHEIRVECANFTDRKPKDQIKNTKSIWIEVVEPPT